MTTATLREEARTAEDAAKWALAAKLWQQAADAYPDRRGSLARKDIAQLEARARSCQGSADFLAFCR